MSDTQRPSVMPYYADGEVTLLLGDTRTVTATLPAGSIDCIVTSPPYFGLRDYGTEGQIGAEDSPAEFVAHMVEVFHNARPALKDDGTLWLNLGDTYSAKRPYQVDQTKYREGSGERGRPFDTTDFLPRKNTLGIPWRVAFALQEDGWTLRNAIVWHKPNAMPESVTDRLSTAHEMLFLLAKGPDYYFDLDAIREQPLGSARSTRSLTEAWNASTGLRPHTGHRGSHELGKNPGDVWSINTQPYSDAHFATFPMALPSRCIKAGSRVGGTVLDPFSGSGTTGAAARNLDRKYVGIDLNPAYHDLAVSRFAQGVLTFSEEAS